MPNVPMTQLVAMDLSGTGTLVDVSAFVRGADGVQKTPTQQDQFRDATASTFQFILENYDGRFTPGNPSSPYPNPPTERMTVCWSIGNQLRAGSIISITLAEDNWTAVSITCDDMLGAASRNTFNKTLADAVTTAAGQFLLWPMDDAAGASFAVEASGGAPMTATSVATLAFGKPALPGFAGTQLLVTS